MKPAVRIDSPALIRQVTSRARVIFGGSSVHGQAEPQLAPGTRALTFQFASLSYGSSAGISYQYFLEGADKDWSGWGKQKEANYSGLGPNNYRFRVRSQAEDGHISPEGDFAFTILPPWYRTRLAYFVYFLLFALVTYVAWRMISQYERKKARLRTQALEAQAKQLEATVIPRTRLLVSMSHADARYRGGLSTESRHQRGCGIRHTSQFSVDPTLAG